MSTSSTESRLINEVSALVADQNYWNNINELKSWWELDVIVAGWFEGDGLEIMQDALALPKTHAMDALALSYINYKL